MPKVRAVFEMNETELRAELVNRLETGGKKYGRINAMKKFDSRLLSPTCERYRRLE